MADSVQRAILSKSQLLSDGRGRGWFVVGEHQEFYTCFFAHMHEAAQSPNAHGPGTDKTATMEGMRWSGLSTKALQIRAQAGHCVVDVRTILTNDAAAARKALLRGRRSRQSDMLPFR